MAGTIFKVGAAGLALGLFAGGAFAQNLPGASNNAGSPCGWNNEVGLQRGAFAVSDHPNVLTPAGTSAGDALYMVIPPRAWGWAHDPLNMTGFIYPLTYNNNAGQPVVAVNPIAMPDVETWPAMGDDILGRTPDFSGGTPIDLTVIGTFDPGSACPTPGAACGCINTFCGLGLFFASALTQPCTVFPTIIGTGGTVPPPAVSTPLGVALVARYPAGTTSDPVANPATNFWRFYASTNETDINPIGMSGTYDAVSSTFAAFPPTMSARMRFWTDEQTLTVTKNIGMTGTIDRGTGGGQPSGALGDGVGFRVRSLEGSTDTTPGAQLQFLLISATAPVSFDLNSLLGNPTPEPALFTFDPLTLSAFPLFPPGALYATSGAGPFQTGITDFGPTGPTGTYIPLGGIAPATIYAVSVGVDIDITASPIIRIHPTNTVTVSIL